MPKPRALIPRGDLSADEQTTIELFKEASPSVVYITTLVLRRYLFSLNVLEIPQGTGSGIVWDQEGHIVTNFHVIRNANAAKVTLADQSSWDAQLVGTAPEKDLAVLRIETPTVALRPILLG
jgi:S1-C subfamily serine protease